MRKPVRSVGRSWIGRPKPSPADGKTSHDGDVSSVVSAMALAPRASTSKASAWARRELSSV